MEYLLGKVGGVESDFFISYIQDNLYVKRLDQRSFCKHTYICRYVYAYVDIFFY